MSAPSVYAAKLAEYGPEFLQLLLDSGVNLNIVSGPSHKNVLHWAVTAGRSDVVEFLIGKGMDIEKTCGKKFTPLLLAAGLGHSQVADILVKHGAKIDVRSDIGGTPLALSASNDHIEAVKYWLEQGAEVNATDTDGLSEYLLIAFTPQNCY
jgi:ankyrin repeat protein